MDGPRDAWSLSGPGEWVEAATSGRLTPETVADALVVAFTRALVDVMGDPERQAMQAGEASSGEGRATLVHWGRELSMGRETLRQTIVGQRWVRLDEGGPGQPAPGAQARARSAPGGVLAPCAEGATHNPGFWAGDRFRRDEG